MANLIVLPLKAKKRQDITKINLVTSLKQVHRQPDIRFNARVPREDEKKFQAFITLRKARADVRFLGKRLKRMKGEGNWEEDKKTSKKKREAEEP